MKKVLDLYYQIYYHSRPDNLILIKLNPMSNNNLPFFREIFISSLHELFELDTEWICNGMFENNMLIHLEDFISYLNEDEVRKGQVWVLLDELNYLIDTDVIFHKYFRVKSNYIIKDIRKNFQDNKNLKLLANLKILYVNLNEEKFNYIQWIYHYLKLFLIEDKTWKLWSDLDKEVQVLKKLTLTFKIILSKKFWYSRNFLKSRKKLINIKEIVNKDVDFSKAFKRLTNLLLRNDNNYTVLFKIKVKNQFNRNKLSKEDLKILLNDVWLGTIDLSEKVYKSEFAKDIKERFDDFFQLTNEEYIVSVSALWKDTHTAIQYANSDFSEKLSKVILEFNAMEIVSYTSNILIRDWEDKTNYSYWYFWQKEYLNRNYWAIKQVRKLSKVLESKKIEKQLKNTINNSLRYYRLYLNSDTNELRLLNLRIALELIFSSTSNSESNFGNLSKFFSDLIPMNMLRIHLDEMKFYIERKKKYEDEKYKLTGYFWKIRNKILANNPYKNKKKVNSLNGFWIFKYLTEWLLESDKTMWPKYYYYKYKVLGEILSDKSKIFEFVKLFERKSKWIINRIYRNRNFIAHWWWKLQFKDTWNIEWLEYIYLLFMDNLINILSTPQLSTITSFDTYFDRTRRSYNHYIDGINSKNETTIKDKNIIIPSIIF